MLDKDLYNHFVDQKVEIQYFMFRWYTLFLTQEFEIPDVLRLLYRLKSLAYLSIENTHKILPNETIVEDFFPMFKDKLDLSLQKL